MPGRTQRTDRGTDRARRGRRGRAALGCYALAFLCYSGSALFFGRFHTPNFAYFDRLADAFVQGRLDLETPPTTLDLTSHDGRWYVPFPPLPAILLVPWVALRGLAGTNTVLFSCMVGAAGVTAAFLLLDSLRRRDLALLPASPGWFAALLALGTSYWYVSCAGTVWLLAQTCATAFVLLAAWLAADGRSPWLSGAALGAAMLARPHLALAWPLLAGLAEANARRNGGPLDLRARLRWAAASLVPLAVSAAALLAYNQARFGTPLDFGYVTQNVDLGLAADLRNHGQFSTHFVARNLRVMLLAPPVWDSVRARLLPSPEGMSLLLATPPLALLALAARRSRLNPLTVGAWASLVALAGLLSLYYNTGWAQFGYRFSLDFLPAALVLLAAGLEPERRRLFQGLVVGAVLINAWGLVWWYSIQP